MASKIRHALFISIIVIGLFFSSINASYAGTIIQYNYDEAGNRTEELKAATRQLKAGIHKSIASLQP